MKKLKVLVHPNSKHPRIEIDMLEMTHIYVAEPPLEGRANEAVLLALSTHLKVRKNDIFLVSGHKSKIKHFEIKSI